MHSLFNDLEDYMHLNNLEHLFSKFLLCINKRSGITYLQCCLVCYILGIWHLYEIKMKLRSISCHIHGINNVKF